MEPSVEAIVQAVRAEERANAAHERLDRMNGSIDKLRTSVDSAKAELSAKLDALYLQSAKEEGVEQGAEVARRMLIDSRRFVITTIIALVVGLIGSVATLVWLALGG